MKFAHAHAAISIALLACACDEQPKIENRDPDGPDVELVDRIERLLAKDHCVGSLDRWERHYHYHAKDPQAWVRGVRGPLDRSTILFSLREAGFEEFRAGKHIDGPVDWFGIDDRRYKFAYGQYDVSDDEVSIKSCGSN